MTVQNLDQKKAPLLIEVAKLVDLKKKLYSNVPIESAMSEDEKNLTKSIALLFSKINDINIEKRNLRKAA